jgi:hypothetical protein
MVTQSRTVPLPGPGPGPGHPGSCGITVTVGLRRRWAAAAAAHWHDSEPGRSMLYAGGLGLGGGRAGGPSHWSGPGRPTGSGPIWDEWLLQ